jgi:hypothetical protein
MTKKAGPGAWTCARLQLVSEPENGVRFFAGFYVLGKKKCGVFKRCNFRNSSYQYAIFRGKCSEKGVRQDVRSNVRHFCTIIQDSRSHFEFWSHPFFAVLKKAG